MRGKLWVWDVGKELLSRKFSRKGSRLVGGGWKAKPLLRDAGWASSQRAREAFAVWVVWLGSGEKKTAPASAEAVRG